MWCTEERRGYKLEARSQGGFRKSVRDLNDNEKMRELNSSPTLSG